MLTHVIQYTRSILNKYNKITLRDALDIAVIVCVSVVPVANTSFAIVLIFIWLVGVVYKLGKLLDRAEKIVIYRK